ncbi:MAG: endonuclease/exonuclease/phosphatase family protein [Saprospiraceae bacterium]|nr:endonuclease/exonuclease/phosphatase family protein [Saprospiraceae bacterium]MDW8228384.1 endonuclease/exonuclease/phosphatase family protein [Saprospiraceae bacterium]
MFRNSLLFRIFGVLFVYTGACAQASFSVLTYNIRYDNPADGPNAWSERRHWLADQIRFYAPDILGVQEALKPQLDFLQEQLPAYAWVGVGRDDGREAGEYSAIFYRKNRFRVEQSGTFWLSPTPEQVSKGWDAALPRICTWALLEDTVARRRLWVFNTHFDHIGQAARRQSASLLLMRLWEMNRSRHPAIVMGDFNAGPNTEPIQILLRELYDTRTRSQEPPFGPDGTFNGFRFHEPVELRIDYIFTTDRLRTRKYAVLSDSKNCRYPSDHLPVYVVLEYE